MSLHPYQILLGPMLTERALDGQSLPSAKYSFRVAITANKPEIKKAVERAFNVRVKAVNTSITQGKLKRMRTAKQGKRSDWKKAIVTLAEGDAINLI